MVHTATMDEITDATTGRCRACGDAAYGVEPDARGYECESCGASEVYGLEELMMMGELEITED